MPQADKTYNLLQLMSDMHGGRKQLRVTLTIENSFLSKPTGLVLLFRENGPEWKSRRDETEVWHITHWLGVLAMKLTCFQPKQSREYTS